MDVVSQGPLGVASCVWPSAQGGWSLTVVCRATYLLSPGESPLHPDQEPPVEEDTYWDDDPRKSLSSASDLVPFKPRADVVLVGSAFAPGGRPVRSIVARLLVGAIDKSVEAFADRAFQQTGALVEGPRVTQVPLRYERAGGGPGTSNPAGVRPDASPDSYGVVTLPNLQPPGLHVTQPGTFIEPACFGPLAPGWPTRARRVGPNAAGWSPQRWSERPLPQGLEPAFFNVAPADQQVNELRANERLVLENLHRDHPRLATSLPGLSPIAVVERAGGVREPVAMTADTLSIDTARGTCALVWRGWVRLRHREEAGRVVVTLGSAGETAAEAQVADAGITAPLAPGAGKGAATPFGGAIVLDAPGRAGVDPKTTAPLLSRAGQGPATPFEGAMVPEAQEGDPTETLRLPPLVAPASPQREPAVETLVGVPAAAALRDPLPFRAEAPAVEPEAPAPAPAPVLGRALVALGYGTATVYAPVVAPELPVTVAEAPAAPEPPALIGPLARVVMPAASEEEEEEEAVTVDEPPVAVPPAEPEPGDFPIERCGALTAAIAMARPETEELLKVEGLTAVRWEAITRHWDEAIRQERARGRNGLLRAFDAAYVGRVEERRGPIRMEEYARLVVGAERGTGASVAYELGLPRGAPMRIERVWALRMLREPAFGRRVREVIAAERAG